MTMNYTTQHYTPPPYELHKNDSMQAVVDCALEAARMLCGMSVCPYEDEERREQFRIVLNWRNGVGKHKRTPTHAAQLAALSFQTTRGTNGQPRPRISNRIRRTNRDGANY